MQGDLQDPNRVLATLYPSPPRRYLAVGVLGALGLLLMAMGMRGTTGSLIMPVILVVAGSAAIWGAVRLWGATTQGLMLTAVDLRSTDGQVLARVADIARVDQGVLTLKPTGGFGLALRVPGARVWQPGLWWRAGRRVGIGGVTGRAAARHMAQQITALVAGHRMPPR